MLSSFFLVTLFAALAARADPDPSEPGPGSVYNEGSTCHISWDPDTSGTWKTMNIELMCGDNYNMIHLTTVATVDGTDTTKTSYDYPCPEVTPNSAIYFYQFTSPDSSDTLWTTRFAIADADGKTTPPANQTQPNGDDIPWGVGALVDPSSATPPPTKGSGGGGGVTVTVPPASQASNPASSTVVTIPPASSAPAGVSVPPSVETFPSSAAPAGPAGPGSNSRSMSSKVAAPTGSAVTNGTGSANTTGGAISGAVTGVSVNSRLTQAVATLAVLGAAFAVVL